MALRNPQLKAFARGSCAGVVVGRQARHLRALDAGVGARVRAGRRRHRRAACSRAGRDALALVAVRRVVRELAALPRQPGRASPPRGLRRPPVRDSSPPSGRPVSSSGIPTTWAARFAATGARYVVLVTKHMDGYCLWPTDVPQPAPAGLELPPRRRRRARARRCAARGCASASTTRAGSTGRSTTGRSARWPTCSTRSRAATIPPTPRRRCASSSRRYRPSVLWNDIAWPAEGKQLWPLFAHYYEQVPDGVVNDRWMPWSPLLAAARSQLARRGDRRGRAAPGQARRGRHPADAAALRRAHARVRRVRRRAAQAVGVRAGHGPELRLQRAARVRSTSSRTTSCSGCSPTSWPRAATCSSTSGPAASTRRSPTSSSRGSSGSASGSRPHADAIVATRPWVTPGTTTPDGHPVRYTARDDTVYAFVQGATGPITLPDVTATPTTAVTTRRRHRVAVARLA